MALAILLLLPACSGGGAPGTGWSRAPDLSVYAAMQRAGHLARERDVLCGGANPVVVEDRWRLTHGAREAWLGQTLAARYGIAALAASRFDTGGRDPCPAVPDYKWREAHAELLRTLELRLYPESIWRAAAVREGN